MTGREIGFGNLMPISTPVTMGRPATEFGRAIRDAITPPPVQPAVTFVPNPERRTPGPLLAIIGQQAVTMGEGNADVALALCSIHGEQPNIAGYCDGGYQTVSVCLKCCAEIYQAWLAYQAAKAEV